MKYLVSLFLAIIPAIALLPENILLVSTLYILTVTTSDPVWALKNLLTTWMKGLIQVWRGTLFLRSSFSVPRNSLSISLLETRFLLLSRMYLANMIEDKRSY